MCNVYEALILSHYTLRHIAIYFPYRVHHIHHPSAMSGRDPSARKRVKKKKQHHRQAQQMHCSPIHQRQQQQQQQTQLLHPLSSSVQYSLECVSEKAEFEDCCVLSTIEQKHMRSTTEKQRLSDSAANLPQPHLSLQMQQHSPHPTWSPSKCSVYATLNLSRSILLHIAI